MKINKKAVMVIGAGFGQLPAILKAKELGIKVVSIDNNPNAVGVKHSDFFENVDVIDKEGAIEVARKYKINGVLTLQTDLPVPTVGAIVDALNLKGASEKVADLCSNKIKTRKLFRDKGIPQPEFELVTNNQQAIQAIKRIGLPCIIKASDSSGSRGVTKVNNESEVSQAVDEAFKYARQRKILVEEYITGLEIGAQGFSIDGKCLKVLVHNDTLSGPPYMIPTGHSFPVMISSSEEERIIITVKNAVEALGIRDGPSNIDLILGKDQNPKIIEIGARIGATCLPELVEYYSGIDWVKQAIKICIGDEVDLNEKHHHPVHAEIMVSPKDGILKSYKIPESVTNHPQLLEYEITAKIGQQVNRLRKGTDRIGKIIVVGEQIENLEELAKTLRDELVFNITESRVDKHHSISRAL